MITAASYLLSHSIVFAALSAFNELVRVLFLIMIVPACFKTELRRRPLLWILASVLCVGLGVFRMVRLTEGADPSDVWGLCRSLLPYVCALLLIPFRNIWKTVAVAAGHFLSDVALLGALTVFFRYSPDEPNDALELLVDLIVNVLLLCIVLILLRLRNRTAAAFESLSSVNPLLYVSILVTATVFFVTTFGIASNYSTSDKRQFWFTLLNVPLFGFTVTYLVTTLIKSRTAEENWRKQLELQINHYEMMDRMNEDLRIFRHDMPKKLRPLAAYAENGDLEGVREIAKELGAVTLSNPLRFHTGNYRLDTVLFCQQQIAQKDNTTIVLTPGSVFPAEGVDANDIYTIFPNALDNAIEACRNIEGEKRIVFTSKIAGGTVFVTISNPVLETPIVSNGLIRTTKEDKSRHGYGLKSIKKAAGSYGSDNLEIITGNNSFELRLALTLKTDKSP